MDHALKHQAKLKELQTLFKQEAQKYQVEPLNNTMVTGLLKVGGKPLATQKLERTLTLIVPWDENLDFGPDAGMPVSDADEKKPMKAPCNNLFSG